MRRGKGEKSRIKGEERQEETVGRFERESVRDRLVILAVMMVVVEVVIFLFFLWWCVLPRV